MSNDTNYALICAVRAGDLDRVKTMIDTFGLSYSKGWSQGYKLLIEALMKKRSEVARLLLISGAKVNSKNTRPTETPLHMAVKNNDVEIVNMLLDRHADVNAVDKGGDTPLHKAVARGNAEIVSSLLMKGARVDASTISGKTPLYIAAECGQAQIAEYLLNYGACVNGAISKGWNKGYTPLHCASEQGYETLVELLLRKGADINASTEDKSTALHIAAKMKREKVVKVLLKHGGVDVNAQDKNGKTVLQVAIEKGDLFTVTHILELCPEINKQQNEICPHDALYGQDGKTCRNVIKTLLGYEITVNSDDAKNVHLLHAAVEKGCLKIIEDLYEYGADMNSSLPDKSGYTLLHNAAKNNQIEVAKLLINHGADVNVKDIRKQLPISYAIENNHANMTKLLLSSGIKINDGNDLLNIAVVRNSKETVEVILREFDFDINAGDHLGQTALHCAMLEKDFDGIISKMLLNKGAKVNAKEQRKEETALHFACRYQKEKVVPILLEYGAEIDSRNREDTTPLQIAAGNGCLKIVKILLDLFAEVKCRDKYGRTALHIASMNGWPEVVEELLHYGSDINSTCNDGYTPLKYASNSATNLIQNQYFNDDSDSEDFWDDGSNGSENGRFDQLIEILKQHIVKMKALNLCVSQQNLELVDIENKHKDFYIKCKDEVEMMKNEKISDTKVSFNDLSTKGISQLAIYARNESIVEILESGCYKKKFPIYADIIYNNFKKGQKRQSLLNSSRKSLKILSGFVLPDLSSAELLSYLSNKDLVSLTKACLETNSGEMVN